MKTQNIILFCEACSEGDSLQSIYEQPITMTETQTQEMFGSQYGHRYRNPVTLHEDVKAIERSMTKSHSENRKAVRRKNRKRKHSTLRIPNLENIEEEELSEPTKAAISQNEHMSDIRDLAAIHRERALGCGAGRSQQNEGRRFRHKKYTRIRLRSNST